MALTINKIPEEGYKYIPKSEAEEKKPFAVWVKPLDKKDLFDLEDRMVQRQGEEVYIAQGIFSFKVAQQGIIKWENINTEDGKEIVLEHVDGVATEESIANIPAEIITEVAGVISAISRDPALAKVFFPDV